MQLFDKKFRWFALGLACGVVGMFCFPRPNLKAMAASQSPKFAMCTTPAQLGNPEAVFVVDFVTGRLIGGAFNTQSGGFTQSYSRDLAADFNVAEDAQYVMVPGEMQTLGAGVARGGAAGGSPATGGIYIGELTSGLVILYGFRYTNSNRQVPDQSLVKLAQFPWRQALK